MHKKWPPLLLFLLLQGCLVGFYIVNNHPVIHVLIVVCSILNIVFFLYATKRKKKVRQYIKEECIENGVGIIDLCLYEGLSLFHPLSYGNDLELNGDIYDFIEEKASMIPLEIPLKICFHGNLEKEEEGKVEILMREHYRVRQYDIEWDFYNNRLKIVALSVIGILILTLYFVLALYFESDLFLEVLSIIGTFALWEAVDFFLLERSSLKYRLAENQQLSNMEITFIHEKR